MSEFDRASWSLNNPAFTGWNFTENVMYRANLYWDPNALAWVKATGGAIPGANVNVTNLPAVQPVSATSWPLPTGASTEATLGTRVADSTITARLNTLGQKTMAASAPVVLASDYVPVLQQDLIGNANNYYPTKSPNFVLGAALNVSTTRQDIWQGPTPSYVFPATPMQMQVLSTSSNDAAAGTGVQTVHIHYLDNTFLEQSTVVTLNGITPVLTTPTNIFRINGFHATSVGSLGTSAGNISLQAVGGAVTYGFIVAGFNMARQAVFTIPAGKTGYISEWIAEGSTNNKTGNSTITMTLRARSHLGIPYPIFLAQDEILVINSSVPREFKTPIPIPATTDFKVSVINNDGANPATVGCRVSGWYE